MRWCIFYDDGSTFSNEEGNPEDAPVFGVQVIVQDWCQPPQVIHKTDFYWWRPDDERWAAGDIFGFIDQSANFGATWVKQGRTIYGKNRDAFKEINARAVKLHDEWSEV